MKVRWMLIGMFVLSLLAVAPHTFAQSRQGGGGGGTTIALRGSRAFPNAIGSAKYKASAEEREFQVEVQNVPQLAGKTLVVFVDGTKAGTLLIDSTGHGALNLNTQLGQMVPMVHAGSVVTVQTRAGQLVVAGRFPA